MSVPGLSYIALSVRDIGLAAAVLGDDLGLARTEISLPGGQATAFPVGQTALVLLRAGDDFLTRPGVTGVDHIALSVDDAAALLSRLGVRCREAPGPQGGEQTRIDPAATAGVAVRLGPPLGIAFEPGPHIDRVDHIGIASAGNREAEAVFDGRFGCPVESRQTDMEVRTAIESFTSDKYGVVYHTRPPEPVGGLRVSFLTVGDTELEFLQDFDPAHGTDISHGAPGTTKQDQGAIGRYIAKRGAGLHHLALKAFDIDGTLAHLAARGRRLIDVTGRPGSRRGRIGFVHPEALGGVLLHFVERQDLTSSEK